MSARNRCNVFEKNDNYLLIFFVWRNNLRFIERIVIFLLKIFILPPLGLCRPGLLYHSSPSYAPGFSYRVVWEKGHVSLLV